MNCKEATRTQRVLLAVKNIEQNLLYKFQYIVMTNKTYENGFQSESFIHHFERPKQKRVQLHFCRIFLDFLSFLFSNGKCLHFSNYLENKMYENKCFNSIREFKFCQQRLSDYQQKYKKKFWAKNLNKIFPYSRFYCNCTCQLQLKSMGRCSRFGGVAKGA